LTPARRAAILVAVTVLALLALRADVTPALRGPAPYPPEWRWGLATKPLSGRVVPALACAAGLLALLALSAPAAASRWPRAALGALLSCAAVLGLGLQLGLRHVDEEGAVAALVRRTISGSFTSFHTVAASPFARDPAAFLSHHHELIGRFRHHGLHAATHPPGPVLFYRWLIGLCRRASALAARLDRMVTASGLDTAVLARPPPSAEGVAAALLGPLLIGLFGVLACWPTAALARSLHGDAASATRAGILWTLVPAVALMTPEMDQALALPVTGSAALLAAALWTPETSRAAWIALALAAGALAAIAAFFSYGAILFVVVGTVAVLATGWRAAGRRAAAVLLLALAGALAVLSLERLAGHRPLVSALVALAIHREQFTARRSYLVWLAFDPLDLFWFLGPPLAVLILGIDVRAIFRAPAARGVPGAAGPSGTDRFRAAAVLSVGALILSGVLRGEAGRILLPIMPLLLVAAVSKERADAEGEWAAGPPVGLAVLLGALLTATSLVIRLTWDVP
jgi:hypothetical protein